MAKYGDLFKNNKQATVISKYLKNSSPGTLGGGIESEAHLKSALIKRDEFLPNVNYGNPEQFVRFGSAEKYYDNAFDYVAGYYPYDGSKLEKTDFYNNLNPLEQYILDEKYPTSTGFINVGTNYGTISNPAGVGPGFYSSSLPQYVQIKGGPHLNTQYSTTDKRTSNLEFGGTSGTTVEFFLKKDAPIDSSVESENQIIIDIHNGDNVVAQAGQLRIQIDDGQEDRFFVTLLSSSVGCAKLAVPSAGGLTICDGKWRNYSFAFDTAPLTGNPTVDFYVDGACIETGLEISGFGHINEVTGTMVANLGALRFTDGIANLKEGYGKLSGSVDEFRFWKTKRNPEQVGRYWFTNINGGTDKYSANVDLGVYMPFNEGITLTASIDNVVLDYSGRLSNGSFVGYQSSCRSTGSAINSLALTSITEEGNPIIRVANNRYINSKYVMTLSGSVYDQTNNSRLLNSVPHWIREEDQNTNQELQSLTQILGSYFDTLHNQLAAIPALKQNNYVSGSITDDIKEFPYNYKLLENFGIEAPEIFENIGTLAQFLQRDEQIDIQQRLVSIKNMLYKNIYNNLNGILKSKGNAKSIRNLIRCLGVDNSIIALNTYSNNLDYKLQDSFYAHSSPKKFLDFSGLRHYDDADASVFQYYSGSTPNSYGLIVPSTTGIELDEYAFTLTSQVFFPNKEEVRLLEYDLPLVVSSSIMGFHTPNNPSPTSTDLTWASSGTDFGLQVYAVKSPAPYSKKTSPLDQVSDAYFIVKDRAGQTLLTSGIYGDIYDNQKWNLALSVKPRHYPLTKGGVGPSPPATLEYVVDLYGANFDSGIKRNHFHVSSSFTAGPATLNSAKRIYAGAHKTDYTGITLQKSDVRIGRIQYWTDYLNGEEIDSHAESAESFGRKNPYQNAYEYQESGPNVFIPKIQTLSLNWDFETDITANSTGLIPIYDYSSGSSNGDYPSTYQGALFSNLNLRQHTGRGIGFTSADKPSRKQYVYTSALQKPEYVDSNDMVKVPTNDDKIFGQSIRPQSYYFAVEKSLYNGISSQILELFASIEEFNNLIGEPVNKYRLEYKRMEKLREVYFRRVHNSTIDFEKYVDYYKWLDASMNEIIQQLFPFSAKFSPNVRKLIESHVLERPKIQYKFPIIRNRLTDPGDDPPGTISKTSVRGTICGTGQWKYTHAPISQKQNVNCNWWKTMAKRDNSSFDTPVGLLPTRTAVLKALKGEIFRTYKVTVNEENSETTVHSAMKVVCVDGKLSMPYVGGTNQGVNKKRNIANITFDRFEPLEDCTDVVDPNAKRKVAFRVTTSNGKIYIGDQMAPFTAISGSVIEGGYNAFLNNATGPALRGISLNNLHEDSIFPYRQSVPLQGPFGKTHVGGFLARHAAPMSTKKKNRAEQYKMSIVSGTGSLTTLVTEDIPKGQYLRGLASKSPINIQNIRTATGSHPIANGVAPAGNYVNNYEVVQGSDRLLTNMDHAFNPTYYTSTAPTAFVTPVDRAYPAVSLPGFLGPTGSADYAAPRQREGRRTNQTIIVNQFGAPGDRYSSKQQYRDVSSDQLSPNSPLPYRNMDVRPTFYNRLKKYTGFGGYEQDSTTIASIHKTLRNMTRRIEISTVVGTTTTMVTGAFNDNYFVERPVPSADRPQWYTYLSGADNQALYDSYVARQGRFPENINILTPDTAGSQTIAAAPLSQGMYLNSAKRFLWWNNRNFVPWNQIAAGETPEGSYYWKNNTYELSPRYTFIGNPDGVTTKSKAPGTNTRLSAIPYLGTSTQAPASIPHYYYKSYREAPITSRYKPLLHQIVTPTGTPSKTLKGSRRDYVTTSIYNSYGNVLMGYANRDLNYHLQGKYKFNYNQVKRPYEIIRDRFNQGDQSLRTDVAGITIFKSMFYYETIHPQEVYTYLSASRSRLAFVNDFWTTDHAISSTDVSAFSSYVDLNNTDNIYNFNRQSGRISSSFVTSQGYSVKKIDQKPMATTDPNYPAASALGSGSIWPLDSYLYSDSDSTLKGIIKGETPVVFADAATMACGEMMMTHYGSIDDQATYAPYGAANATYLRSNINSVQYVYSIPTQKTDTVDSKLYAQPLSPGGPLSRPSWTAGSARIIVDGVEKYALATPQYPFYNNYEDFISDAKAKAKDHTILPEFRVSALVEEYKNAGNPFSLIKETLEITGANRNIFNGNTTDFYNRFAVTDGIEFLPNFFTYDANSPDFKALDYPRHFGVSSKAVLQLLPYNGFYPVNRIMQIATLFSSSYGANSQYIGASGSTTPRWRSILKPFYAPGIMLNAIKSGMAVDHPVRVSTRNTEQFIKRDTLALEPLYGPLTGTLTSLTPGGELPGNRRHWDQEAPFDFSSETEVDKFFWGDRLPFETVMNPMVKLDNTQNDYLVISDINTFLRLPASGNVSPKGLDDTLYRKSISNFLANVPEFFLTEKTPRNGKPGYMTKFVSKFGDETLKTDGALNVVRPEANTAYLMEIGVIKTDNFNLYSNPFAYGTPTATGSLNWDVLGSTKHPATNSWPMNRAELAPFSPPYYYGPSVARYLFLPNGDKAEYTLDEIIYNTRNETYVQFLNTSSSYYDFADGTFLLDDGRTKIGATPQYQWNRAWQNRMDLDASIVVNNRFPTQQAGANRIQGDPNSWTVMPKWECPILDFPNITRNAASPAVPPTPGAAATATLTVSEGEGTGISSAAGSFLFGVLANDAQTNGQIITVDDLVTSFSFEFKSGVIGTTFTSPASYEVGTDDALGTLTTTEVRDALYNAIADAIGGASAPVALAATVSKAGSYQINLQATVLGTAMNAEVLSYTNDGSASGQIDVTSWAGGANYTFNSKTLDLEDVAHGVVSYIFDAATLPAASTAGIIGTLGASAADVAGAIAQTINLSNAATAINITAGTVVASAVPLTATVTGTGMNAKTIAGTSVSDGGVVPVAFAGGVTAIPAQPASPASTDLGYDFTAASTRPGSFNTSTSGMWHQYGAYPQYGKGVYMYVKDIGLKETDRITLGGDTGTGIDITGSIVNVRKVPPFVYENITGVKPSMRLGSLARLCGFADEDIMGEVFDHKKAKRLGEIAKDGEKTLSEAVLAMPFYLDQKGVPRVMTIQAPATLLGPKIKQFRKQFINFSMPPSLSKQLLSLVPPHYPNVPEVLNPFGDDDLDRLLASGRDKNVRSPVVYLLEHKVGVSRQDLADIWQGIMPSLTKEMKLSVSSVDHYMPGDKVSQPPTQFPEVLQKQIELDLPIEKRNGHPRWDLLDVPIEGNQDGFIPEIKWFVFKVKKRGVPNYDQMMLREVFGRDYATLENLIGEEATAALPQQFKDAYSQGLYEVEMSTNDPTYNWPYDYFSLVELARLDVEVGFRPELEVELREADYLNTGFGQGQAPGFDPENRDPE